jgi:hypothetical protein
MAILLDWPAIYRTFANQLKELYLGPTVYINLHLGFTHECSVMLLSSGLLIELAGIDPLRGLAALKVSISFSPDIRNLSNDLS